MGNRPTFLGEEELAAVLQVARLVGVADPEIEERWIAPRPLGTRRSGRVLALVTEELVHQQVGDVGAQQPDAGRERGEVATVVSLCAI